MKQLRLFFIASLIILTNYIVYAQSGLTIQSGGAVTVNGNTVINNTLAFVCGNTLIDARDGRSYNTVLLGTQCWFAQNLNVGTKVPGNAVQINNSIIEKYCYNDDENNCTIYGGLYQWDEAMQYSTTEGVKGICPAGWHLPTDAKFTTLSDFLGGATVAGGKMKETGTTHWLFPNTGATNSSGFTGLPGGYRATSGYFGNFGDHAYFMSSTQSDASLAWLRYLYYNVVGIYRVNFSKALGFPARCLKD